jgi:hypothetical protein
MTDHVIIQVRDAVITRLTAASTAAGTRVYKAGDVDVEQIGETVPFLLVRVGQSPRERMAIGSGSDSAAPQVLEDIYLALMVHCVTKMDGDSEKVAYNLAGEVDVSLLATMAGKTLSGLVFDITPVSLDPDQNQFADQQAYQVLAEYRVIIRHLEGAPTSFTY